MMDYVIHPAARREFRAAIQHYAAISPDLAVAFDSRFVECRGKICAHPLRYNVRKYPVRRINMSPRFGEYYLPFMVWNERVVILAVAHAKRRPYYWSKRIGESKRMY